jgi:hypothetical protein
MHVEAHGPVSCVNSNVILLMKYTATYVAFETKALVLCIKMALKIIPKSTASSSR